MMNNCGSPEFNDITKENVVGDEEESEVKYVVRWLL